MDISFSDFAYAVSGTKVSLYYMQERAAISFLGNQFTDRMIHRRKFFLIFGHDITAVHGSIVVKIICTGGHIPDVRSLQFFHGEIEKCPVIGFEFNLSVRNQNLIVAFEVFSGSKSSSGVSCLWPRSEKFK